MRQAKGTDLREGDLFTNGEGYIIGTVLGVFANTMGSLKVKYSDFRTNIDRHTTVPKSARLWIIEAPTQEKI